MLSGDGLLSAVAPTPGGDSEIPLLQDSIPVEVVSAAPGALVASLSYNPQDQLDDIFDVGTADQASDQTEANGAQSSPDAGPIQEQTSDPAASAPAESSEGAAAETGAVEVINESPTGDPMPVTIRQVVGTDGTISNPQVEQLTDTLRAANGPPGQDTASANVLDYQDVTDFV
jgi:hypothetical protein